MATDVQEHIARVVEREPSAAAFDPDAWAAAIRSHLTALPADRPWRVRRWIPASARRSTHLLEQATRDRPALPDAVRRDAARAAWLHLARLGLASTAPDDLCAQALRSTLEPAL